MNVAIAASVPTGRPQARRRWPLIIVGLLVGHTTLMIAFVVIAMRDKSFSVDPDYYGKAVHWDQSLAQIRASEALAWELALRPTKTSELDGSRAVMLELTDSAGQSIPGAVIEATYFHHAHGRESRAAKLTADAADPRLFVGQLLMPQAGTWEFHLSVRAGDRLFVKTVTVEAN